MMQLLEFLLLYILGGVGCALFARLRCDRHNPLDLLSVLLLWPLCAPFLLSSNSAQPEHRPRAAEEEMQVLASHCLNLQSRLAEIDSVLSQENWSRAQVREKRENTRQPGAKSALSLRLEHIERLHFLRKVHLDELEAARGVLDQLQSQAQLSRFLQARESDELPHLDAIRERIADSEILLASETELIALCHESESL